jgi:hypothetical protein
MERPHHHLIPSQEDTHSIEKSSCSIVFKLGHGQQGCMKLAKKKFPSALSWEKSQTRSQNSGCSGPPSYGVPHPASRSLLLAFRSLIYGFGSTVIPVIVGLGLGNRMLDMEQGSKTEGKPAIPCPCQRVQYRASAALPPKFVSHGLSLLEVKIPSAGMRQYLGLTSSDCSRDTWTSQDTSSGDGCRVRLTRI